MGATCWILKRYSIFWNINFNFDNWNDEVTLWNNYTNLRHALIGNDFGVELGKVVLLVGRVSINHIWWECLMVVRLTNLRMYGFIFVDN
jgi:hypothetical protein